ncbi:MAG: N-acetyltransferase [Hyphomicrobiaceae bacterium]|nr:N-acetyltransferase [Hyphomicrobiaceae bacterium]
MTTDRNNVETGSATDSGDRVLVRSATHDDIAEITAIYAHSVATSAASFELVAPTVDEMTARFNKVLAARCAYLVAASHVGSIVGFAYTRPFHERPAFGWTVEDSIYLAPDAQGRGIGRRLLARLVAEAETAGFRQMIAVIAAGASPGSVALHRAMGFADAGLLTRVGFKLGRWHDIAYMQRPLGDAAADDAPIPPPGLQSGVKPGGGR